MRDDNDLLPKILKADRDIAGNVSLKMDRELPVKSEAFQNLKGKNDLAYSSLYGGISWPYRSAPGYACIVGLLAGAKPSGKGAHILVWEHRFESALQFIALMTNVARDLRFSRFFTNLKFQEWEGFNRQWIAVTRSMPDIRLEHSPRADEFIYGADVVDRWGRDDVILMPESILLSHILKVKTSDLHTEHPEEQAWALNGFRFAVMAYDFDAIRALNPASSAQEAVWTPEAWS